jgi:NAD(P)H dehydrogenase (quinone)
MRVFIVHAHHEPSSFNAALTRTGTTTLRAHGHDVAVSDLHAMGFDPVSDRRNFATVADAERLQQQTEERHASTQGSFVPALQAEMDKLAWCDALVLQFPMWWMGMPAILKGWIDRVFAVGRAYGGGRWFDGGMLAGKRAMCSITVGGPPGAYTEQGIYGAMSMLLHPIHRGVLGFVGFTVVEPFVVHAPSRMTAAERELALARFGERLVALPSAPTLEMPRANDYDAFVRKPEVAAAEPGRAP